VISVINPRPYKKVAREQAEQRTREALLDAAVDEFYSDRWRQTSLEKLARRAGVTKQTLLRHFGSKDGLLVQALIHGAAKVLDERWSAPRGDVDGVVENLLTHYEASGERARHIGAWQQSGSGALTKLSQVGRQLHYDWVDFAFGPQLERLDGQPRERCRAALIAICDLQTWWILAHDLALPRAEVKKILIGMIERLAAEPE
jgi:AcrR family transcriptional regulator